MRVLATCALFALLATASASTPPAGAGGIDWYISTLSAVDGRAETSQRLAPLIKKLSERHAKSVNAAAFVDFLFDRTRQYYLRDYAEYATFTETLSSGTYNCLTGTALYALLLDHFGVPYQIIETNYHIFLIADVGDERILLEATDAANGFVRGEANIEARIEKYRQGLPAGNSRKKVYEYDANLYKEVSLDEVAGLLYFNRAIVAYNRGDLVSAIEQLTLSAARYQSQRTAEFATILQITVAESNMNPQDKRRYVREIQQVRASVVSLSARHSPRP